jgi:sugar phosphate isomerase/epimerase
MKFGICTSLDNAAAVKAAGWDYVEIPAKELLDDRPGKSPLPMPAANMLVPASLKIAGPDADPQRLRDYMSKIVERAANVGMTTLVFGSGFARHVPEGFDRDRAKQQIVEFATTAAEVAWERGVSIVLEPLNRNECNIINTVAEAIAYVKAVRRPGLVCLVDTYHLWLEDEPLENVDAAVRSIKHVHVADKDGRVAPGESGKSDYRPLFRILKRGGYDRMISVEGNFPEPMIRERGKAVLDFLQEQWQEA